MMTTSKLPLILDDLAAIKEFLPNLTATELASLGTALVSLTNDTRLAYQAANTARPVAQPQAMYAERLYCTTCNRDWRGPQMVPAGTPPTRTTCGLCKAAERRAPQPMPLPTDLLPSNPVATTSAAVDDGLETLNMTGDLPDGTYTVVFGDGEYRTLKIATQPLDAEFAPGKTTASYLNGPDNYRNYKGFAFVNSNGSYHLYKAFAAKKNDSLIEMALRVLLSGREAMVHGLKAYGIASGKCGMCGHKLTTPESLKRGIGPTCAERLGL